MGAVKGFKRTPWTPLDPQLKAENRKIQMAKKWEYDHEIPQW